MTRIIFVRHGEVHNPDDVYYGRLPNFHLSEHGRAQAQAAALALRDVPLAALFASPQPRAQETAAFIAQHQRASPQTHQLLNEVYSPFDGMSHHSLAQRGYDLYTGSPKTYEQPIDIIERVRGFWSQVRREYAGQTIAAVTHGDIIAFAILWAKGVPLLPSERHYQRFGFPDQYPATASMTTFTFTTADEREMPSVIYARPY
jgi:broad specificity phosphatase PhoE